MVSRYVERGTNKDKLSREGYTGQFWPEGNNDPLGNPPLSNSNLELVMSGAI